MADTRERVGAELKRFGIEHGDERLEVVAPYEPSGDQPQAIAKLAQGVRDGLRYQTLMGVTGSGKTFTMAKTIEAVNKPTLIMEPNKTLAAQVASERARAEGVGRNDACFCGSGRKFKRCCSRKSLDQLALGLAY
jgi:excinuclease ABC subunit B